MTIPLVCAGGVLVMAVVAMIRCRSGFVVSETALFLPKKGTNCRKRNSFSSNVRAGVAGQFHRSKLYRERETVN